MLSAELAMELSLPSSGFAVVQKQIVLLYKPVTLLLVFLTVSGLQVPESVYSQFPLQNGAIPSARFVSLPR
ncbi:MAG: hypothetical protein ACPHF4_11625, partial [Rubripirellula sp.]